MSERAEGWDKVKSLWQSWADSYGYPNYAPEDRPHVLPLLNLDPLPEGVNDALRYSGRLSFWVQPVGIGLYALDDGPAVIVLLEGPFDGKENADGADAVMKTITG
jgi:hypothetical protein